MKGRTIKLLQENIFAYIYVLEVGKDLLNKMQKVQSIKENKDKF